MKVGNTMYYLLSDHLGSTSITTNDSGNVISELRYSAAEAEKIVGSIQLICSKK